MKYKLTDECIEFDGVVLHRIQALKRFGLVKEGDLGGFVQSEDNLSQKQSCWIGDNAKVYGGAKVFNDALVLENAVVCDRVLVWNNAEVRDNATVFGTAKIHGHDLVEGNSLVISEEKTYINTSSRKPKRKPKRSREVLPGVYDL